MLFGSIEIYLGDYRSFLYFWIHCLRLGGVGNPALGRVLSVRKACVTDEFERST